MNIKQASERKKLNYGKISIMRKVLSVLIKRVIRDEILTLCSDTPKYGNRDKSAGSEAIFGSTNDRLANERRIDIKTRICDLIHITTDEIRPRAVSA
jgi:hypothetical protein